MNKALWEKLQPLMDEALSLSAEDRRPWLARVRQESPTIADELEGLLAREGTLDRRGFLDEPLTLGRDVRDALSGRIPTVQMPRLQSALAERYTIDRQVGQGGMAVVYGAHDVRHGRRVAVKVIRPDASSVLGADRFLSEIRLTARLTHPNILPLLDSGEVEGALYYVMPYVEGESLRVRMRRDGALPVLDTVRIVRAVAEALAYAHEQGTVHRDIKPDNILLAGRQAWVADFGIAKAMASSATNRHSATSVGVALGSPGYMAPEQIEGADAVDARADLYSLGVMAWEMLAGKPLFEGTTLQQLFLQHLTVEPVRIDAIRPDVPRGLADAIMRCLAKSPDARMSSATTLLEEIDALSGVSGGHVPLSAPSARRWWWIGGGVAASVIATWWGVGALRASRPLAPERVSSTGDVVNGALSPDGRSIVYRRRTSPTNLWIRQMGDTTPGRVLVPRVAPGLPAWLDDSTLALPARDSTWLVHTRDGRTMAPAWLQGHQLRSAGTAYLYARDTAESTPSRVVIRRVTAGGWGERTAIALDSGETLDRLIRFSQSPAFFVVTLARDSSLQLWRVADTGERTALRRVAPSDTTGLYRWLPRATASADGNPFLSADDRLLLVSTRSDTLLRVDLRRPDAPVTRVPTVAGLFGAPSRDGTLLVRSSEYGGRLWRFPVTDDMERRGSVIDQVRGTVRMLALSPDAKFMAQVEGALGGPNVISLRSLETGTTRRVLSLDRTVVVLDWSPDGSKLGLRTYRQGESQRLAVLDVRDGRLTSLGRPPIRTSSTMVDGGFPWAWSSDSRTLYAQDFAQDFGPEGQQFTGVVPDAIVRRYALVEGDTGVALHGYLTKPALSGRGVDTLWINGIVLSPDGQSLGLGGSTLTVLPLDGGPPRRVLDEDPAVSWIRPLAWRTDGRISYATRSTAVGDGGNVFRTFSVAVKGGAPQASGALPPVCQSISAMEGRREATCFEPETWTDMWLVRAVR